VEFPDGSQAQRIYTHKGISGSGDKAMQERMTKWADGAAFVKQSIDRQYGPGVGAPVFQKIIDDGGPDLSQEVRRRDLKTIQATIDELSGGNIALMAKGLGLGFEDTMAVIRSRGNIRSVPPHDIQAAIQKLYARENLSGDEVYMINYLFPDASS
jgi:hypothetical protein